MRPAARRSFALLVALGLATAAGGAPPARDVEAMLERATEGELLCPAEKALARGLLDAAEERARSEGRELGPAVRRALESLASGRALAPEEATAVAGLRDMYRARPPDAEGIPRLDPRPLERAPGDDRFRVLACAVCGMVSIAGVTVLAWRRLRRG